MFELVRESAAPATVLIVEQNIRQVLKVVDRATCSRPASCAGAAPRLLASDDVRKGLPRRH
jgi:ABC-type branched-subunit amino acid transport system ATPase component